MTDHASIQALKDKAGFNFLQGKFEQTKFKDELTDVIEGRMSLADAVGCWRKFMDFVDLEALEDEELDMIPDSADGLDAGTLHLVETTVKSRQEVYSILSSLAKHSVAASEDSYATEHFRNYAAAADMYINDDDVGQCYEGDSMPVCVGELLDQQETYAHTASASLSR